MRHYNFDVRFTLGEQSNIVCRVHFNSRFDAKDMVGDFPRNVTVNFLNQVISSPATDNFIFREGSGNSVEIVAPSGLRPISDSERAILLNLMDFGQDFEAERSTTIEYVAFPVTAADGQSAEALLQALESENSRAIAEVNELMQRYPSGDDDAAAEWPAEDHDRYIYQALIAAEAQIGRDDADALKKTMHALHEVNMWNGYSTERNPQEAMASGRTGISYEIFTEDSTFSYLVERPSCNPALSILWFWQFMESRLGPATDETNLFVSAED